MLFMFFVTSLKTDIWRKAGTCSMKGDLNHLSDTGFPDEVILYVSLVAILDLFNCRPWRARIFCKYCAIEHLQLY